MSNDSEAAGHRLNVPVQESGGISDWLARRFETRPPARLAVDAVIAYAIMGVIFFVSSLCEIAASRLASDTAGEGAFPFRLLEFVGRLVQSAGSVMYYVGMVFLVVAGVRFISDRMTRQQAGSGASSESGSPE